MVEVASSLRELEAASIRSFVESAAADGYLSGRVLDYGCGKSPYRDIVEAAGGEYLAYDDPTLPGYAGDLGSWPDWDPGSDFDGLLCTQVVQYVPQIVDFIGMLHWFVKDKPGHLVLTYPTNWPEVEPEDLHRFTKAGMERLLTEAGFTILRHERRAAVNALWGSGRNSGYTREELALGYGVICRA